MEKENSKSGNRESRIGIEKVPDDVLIEIFIRTETSEWVEISCVKKHWASLFHTECFWQAALSHIFADPPPQTWLGPIPLPQAGLAKRRFIALHISQRICASDHIQQVDEIVGHCYLFLKDQLQLSIMPPHSGILHGTTIDQFIACGKSTEVAHEFASRIWLAVVDNLEEDQHTFCLLKRLAQEGDVFLPYPYTRSVKVQWRVFEKLFTDFRDCFNHVDYYDLLACAKNKGDGTDSEAGLPEDVLIHDEIYKYRLASIKREEETILRERDRYELEKGRLIREMKRIRDEEGSRFNNFQILNHRYALLNLLGKGGFNEVYKAFDLVEHRYVACKLHGLNAQWSEEKKQSYMRHAIREYNIHKTLVHRHIVRLWDIFEIDQNTLCTVKIHYALF